MVLVLAICVETKRETVASVARIACSTASEQPGYRPIVEHWPRAAYVRTQSPALMTNVMQDKHQGACSCGDIFATRIQAQVAIGMDLSQVAILVPYLALPLLVEADSTAYLADMLSRLNRPPPSSPSVTLRDADPYYTLAALHSIDWHGRSVTRW